ncbi:DNA polymerase III subunit delta' [Marinobacter salinisoli]|uniref:DNA-directed DNA polymerase n=1 Tax=Marinobacter salinisoli TaxID=2769486 RepID=A0ABX7MNB8_9GAMM|nr:DNA polymerase III subunit delta' [Marinobacter salinisoli]QSP93736.1 DNA polymerase III subunit delta' [Marinobacter salinisoli]
MTDIALEMPWLAKAWKTVQTGLRDDRLPHALIIAGERGVGKRAWADAVAQLLLCDQPITDAEGGPVACSVCKQCALLGASSHPDVRAYSPEKSKVIKVDQVRALTGFAVASPQVARRKIAIVDRADQLNINAANALLKTLEEPLPDVTLLLLQESGRPVLPTIRSRCQVLNIPAPGLEQAQAWLEAKTAEMDEAERPSPETLKKALMLAGNAPRLGLEYATGEFIQLRDEAFEQFRQFMKGQAPVTQAARAFKALGLEGALALFEGWAADLARLVAGGAAKDTEAAEMLGYLARTNPGWRAHQLQDKVNEARQAAVYNANPELEAAQLLIEWKKLMPKRRRAS